MKKIYLIKSFNIYNKIKFCLKCHNLINNLNIYPKILNNLNLNYKNLKNFKLLKRYNLNMNLIIINLKNNYIIEILKYFSLFPFLKNKIFL